MFNESKNLSYARCDKIYKKCWYMLQKVSIVYEENNSFLPTLFFFLVTILEVVHDNRTFDMI